MTVTINGTSGITTPGVNSTASNTLGDAVGDTLNVGNGTIVTDASGNVGIGTSSPNSRLVVYGTTDATQRIAIDGTNNYSSFKFRYAGSETAFLQTYQNSEFDIGTSVSAPVVFYTNNSERMRIDSSGNLLVGSTTQISNEKFYVLTNGDTDGICVRNSASSSGKYWKWYNSTANQLFFRNQSNTGVYISDGGTSWNASSDERLKTDLIPISDAVNKVSTLRAVTGRYLTDDSNVSRSFLIAQDVQAVLPEAVDSTNEDSLGLAYSDVIPLLVAAIKELSAKNDALEARITALEAK